MMRVVRSEASEASRIMALATISSFVDGLFQSQLLDAGQRAEVRQLQEKARDSRGLAQQLLRREWLTAFQINQIFQGNGAGLLLGPEADGSADSLFRQTGARLDGISCSGWACQAGNFSVRVPPAAPGDRCLSLWSPCG